MQDSIFNWNELFPGLFTGGVGGFVASALFLLCQFVINLYSEYKDSKRIFNWLNSAEGKKYKFRSTKTIASYTNLTQDRVRFTCSRSKKIFLNTSDTDDELWTINLELRENSAEVKKTNFRQLSHK